MVDFNPRYCEQCSYDLTGLPPVSTCPECGHPFNLRTGHGVKLRPGSDHTFAAKIAHHLLSLTLYAIAGFIVFVAMLGYVTKTIYEAGLYTGLVIGGVFALIATYRFLQERW